jgi:hypothetical protein
MQLSRAQQVLVGVVVVVCVVAGVVSATRALKGPEPMSLSQIEEPPLPGNVKDAWAEVETRRMGDLLSGMDQQTVEKRHAGRLAEFETISAREQGAGGGG